MDLEILDIASDTNNNKDITNHTHYSKLKNSMCGDEIKIKLVIKEDKITDFGYQGKSCIYCQASASLLSKVAINKETKKLKILHESLNKSFIKNSDLKKNWNKFLVIINESNIDRKNCLMLPLKAALKALKISC